MSSDGSTATSLISKERKVLLVVIGILMLLGLITYFWIHNRTQTITLKTPEVVTSEKGSNPEAATLSGTVVDVQGKPIQGAKVTLDDFPGMQPVESSTDGIFTLKAIPKKYGEDVRIRVIAEGYQPNPYILDVVLGAAPPRIKLSRKK